jgi:transmembrane sensor
MTENQPPADSDNPDAISEQATTWFVRLRAESVTVDERRQFRIWHQADPAHREAYAEIAAFWEDADFHATLDAATLSPQILRCYKPAKSPWRRFGIAPGAKPLLAAAASLVIAAIIYRPALSCWQADYCTAVGEIKTVQLSDGSRVTLNSDTALNVNMRNGQRHVQLARGEAFFEVQHDPQHPFQVDGRYSNTRVLGTRFVVRENADSDIVSVVSGVVEVSRDRQNPATLKANDSIAVDARHQSEVSQQPTGNATAWLKGSASFDNAPLKEVIAEIGRYRRGSLIIRNQALQNLKVSGRFDIRDTDKALESLQQTLPIRIYRLTPWLVLIA